MWRLYRGSRSSSSCVIIAKDNEMSIYTTLAFIRMFYSFFITHLLPSLPHCLCSSLLTAENTRENEWHKRNRKARWMLVSVSAIEDWRRLSKFIFGLLRNAAVRLLEFKLAWTEIMNDSPMSLRPHICYLDICDSQLFRLRCGGLQCAVSRGVWLGIQVLLWSALL